MTPSLFDPVPFLTRKMLAFEHAVKIELRVTSKSNLNQLMVIKGITREGVFKYNFTSRSDGFAHTDNFRLTDIPIWLSIADSVGNAVQGEIHCQVDLLFDGDPVLKMCSGWVYAIKDLSWPEQNLLDSRLGGGRLYAYTGTNPAAGAEISENMPIYDVIHLKSFRVTFITDATVATRRVGLYITDGAGRILYQFWPTQTQAASLSYTYQFMEPWGDTTSLADNIVLVPLPSNLYIPGGSTLKSSTPNKAAGDNYGAPTIYTEMFLN